MDHRQQFELQRAISGPVSASIQTMNDSSFLVFSDKVVEEDSDEEDLDRYTDVGLREQLFITLSRAIRSTQNSEPKITESAVPESIKNKRGPQRRKLNPLQSQTPNQAKAKQTGNAPLTLPKQSYSKYNDSHTNNHNNDLQYHGRLTNKPPKNKLQSYNDTLSKNAAYFKYVSPIQSSPNHSSIMKHKENNHPHKPKLATTATSDPSTFTIKDRNSRSKHKKIHKRQQSNIRHYSSRLNGGNNDDGTYIFDEYDNYTRFSAVPASESTNSFSRKRKSKSPKIHSTQCDQHIISRLEQVRKDKSETILQNLPPTSRTPKASRHGKIDIAAKFRFKEDRKPQKHGKKHKNKQVPTHISSRGMPPPPGQIDIYQRQFINKHKHKKTEYKKKRNIPPPPPKKPPIMKGKSLTHKLPRNRHKSPPPKSRSTHSHSDNKAMHKYKHSYNGPSYGTMIGQSHKYKMNKKPKPNKSPPPPLRSKLVNSYQSDVQLTYVPVRQHRARSRSKDSIDMHANINSDVLSNIAADVDDNNHHSSHSFPLYSLPMKQDKTGKWLPTSRTLPPPPGLYKQKHIQQRHTAPPDSKLNKAAVARYRHHAHSSAEIPVGLFGRMKNETKYNSMGAHLFNQHHIERPKYIQPQSSHSNHSQYNSSSMTTEEHTTSEDREIGVMSTMSVSNGYSVSDSYNNSVTCTLPTLSISHSYSAQNSTATATATGMDLHSKHSHSHSYFLPPSINKRGSRVQKYMHGTGQVYKTPPMRNKLEKMKLNTLKPHIISPITYESNVNIPLDPICDDASTTSPLSPLQDKEHEEDDDDNLSTAVFFPDSPTRHRARNRFTIKDVKDHNANNVNKHEAKHGEDSDPGESDIPMVLPDYLSASEYLLCDPTLDPKRNLYKLNKNPVKNIRARGATWIGKIDASLPAFVAELNRKIAHKPAGLPPSTTSPALGVRVDRKDSLFRGAQIKENKTESQTDFDVKQLITPFEKESVDFENIHQRFAQEFANKIFGGHLKSYQRAFMPISPQHLGLVDFGNIRSRRRAVFGGNNLRPCTQFEGDHSAMDISIEKRNLCIAKFVAQNELRSKKKFKKSYGKELPKRKKKYKMSLLSDTCTSLSDVSSSYSLSITVDGMSHTSHYSHKSTSSMLNPSLYPEYVYKDSCGLSSKKPVKNKKTWQKLLSFNRTKKKKRRKSSDYITLDDDYKSLTMEDPSDDSHKTKDDMLYGSSYGSYEIKGFDYDDAMYKTNFQIDQITANINVNQLKRGDVIFIMDYEHIDVENEDLNSFLTKYKMQNFLKRMAEEENKRKQQLESVRHRSTLRLFSDSVFSPSSRTHTHSQSQQEGLYDILNRPRGQETIDVDIELGLYGDLPDLDRLEDWKNKQGAAHCMIVLQNIGSSVEVAHVTCNGGTRSFIRQFDAEKIAQLLYLRALAEYKCCDEPGEDDRERSNTAKSSKIVEALGRGPPVAYRCVVYRLGTVVVSAKKFANEAANVAENLVKGGRVLGDPAIFAGSMQRYMENPEKYFYRFLLSSNASLFRRTVRLQFDEGTSFFNFSSSEFIALCFQRALVNKKSFDRQLIRLLDFCPHLTPPPLLQKYIHLNIDEHADWLCLGNVFVSYL